MTEIKRNKRFIKAWIKALRSGKYKQIQSRLESERGYCCLGVACKISSKTERVVYPEGKLFYVAAYGWRGDMQHDSKTLPWKMREYIGITVHEEQILIAMNDRRNSFEAIADKLEQMIQ